MIRTGTLFRAELYDDHAAPYTTAKKVYDANKTRYPDKTLVVTNAHWYGAGAVPVGNYKVGGTVISHEWDSSIGFGWSGNEQPVMGWNDMGKCENFVGTVPAIMDGKRLDVSGQTAGVKRSCLRTWWGFDADGKCTVEVTTANYTLDEIIDRMAGLGIINGLVLDGSGSSQCYDGTTLQTGDGRTIYSYLLLWFNPSGLTIRDAGLKFAYALKNRARTTMIVLHHAAADGSVETVHAYHKGKGWAGIAYHYYVRKNGSIWRGRPEGTVGGHTYGYNSTSIGICAEGNFDKETMKEPQKSALTTLVADVRTRYPVKVLRHSDLNATSCPGANYPFADITGEHGSAGILAFQVWLNSGYGTGISEDGISGPATRRAAVRAFQRIVGIETDGVVGPRTKSKMPNLKTGDTGTLVIVAKGLLYCSGFDPGDLDADFDGDTESAVREYQAGRGLASDGIVGKNTWTALMG